MFDGSFKASRKVNLSGRKKPVYGFGASASASSSAASASSGTSGSASTRDELLQQTKRLREERALLKKRVAASTAIQALVRRVAVTRRARTRVFGEVETELGALLARVDIRSHAVEDAALRIFLRKFLFAHGPHGFDQGYRGRNVLLAREVSPVRLRNVQDYIFFMLLVSALKGVAASGHNVLAMIKDAAWLHQIARILEIAMRVAVTTRFASPLEQATSPYVLVLDTFTTRERYVAVGVNADESENTVRALRQRLARMDHGQFGTFEAMRRLVLKRDAVAPNGRVALVVARLAAQALEQANGDRRIMEQFVRKIILTPGGVVASPVRQVMRALSPSSATPEQLWFHEGRFWAAALTELEKSGAEKSPLTWDQRAVVAGNVFDLIALSDYSPLIVQTGAAVLSHMVATSHVEWAFDVDIAASTTATTVIDVGMDDDEDMQYAPPVLPGTHAQNDEEEVKIGIQALREQGSIVKEQWQQLGDSRFARRCFDGLLDNFALGRMCSVYAIFLTGLGRTHLFAVRQSFKTPPPALFAFLSAMSSEYDTESGSQAEPVVRRLWNLLKLVSNKHSSSGSRFSDSNLRPLLVFNVIYSHMLLALDDETFYDRSWPFQLDDVREVAAFLKQFIYETCWNVSSTSTRSSPEATTTSDLLFPTLTTAVKLFNQLYDRDCRRRFTADGAWLWPAMPVIRETVDLESMEGELYEVQALSSLMSGNPLPAHARASLILTTIPQVFSFTDRVQLFEKLLEEEKLNMAHMRDEFSRAIQVRIKRDEIVDESFDFFQQVCEKQSPAVLKSRIKVTFINEQGLEEAGIDGGGVFKEYVDQLTKNAFSPEYGFFLATSDHLLYPNPAARLIVDTTKDLGDRFRFLGRVLGKAVYESILVEPQFAAFFLNKLQGKFNYIDDLHSLDPDMYRNLMQLKHYRGNVEDLALTFSVSEKEFGQVVTRNLIPDGASIPVTNENRIRYIHLLANYKLNVLSSGESAAFLRGFRDLIPAKWIQMFSPSELQMLIGGTANKIDVVDWQRHTMYGGGYHPSQRVIQWFWDIVEHDFAPQDRAALLKFITSVSRQPLLGFGQLAPQICIHQVRIDDDERLPSSATCMNLLKLPTYSSKEIMRKKLLYAIQANAGFDLS